MSTNQWRFTRAGPAAVSFVVALAGATCAPLPRGALVSARQADYFASQRELPPRIVDALEAGHILLGMDTKQVWVALGDPARKTRFDRSATEVWLYKAARLHQDHYRLGNQDVRLVFVKDHLVAIEPL